MPSQADLPWVPWLFISLFWWHPCAVTERCLSPEKAILEKVDLLTKQTEPSSLSHIFGGFVGHPPLCVENPM